MKINMSTQEGKITTSKYSYTEGLWTFPRDGTVG